MSDILTLINMKGRYNSMTYQEVLTLLNDLTAENPKHFRRIGGSLESAEEVVVCDYISDFEAQDEKFDIWGRLPAIISIANNYPKMPSVIKQVLFYTGVACKINKMASLEELHKFIESSGLNISHNFFSRLGVSAYVDMLLYKQPKMPFNYAGQKHGELGAALKHLIYQAGVYDVFVDIFGGSGAAFVAFPRRRNAVYVYNDLDKNLTNLFEVIAGEKQHLVLIDYLTKLQEDLKGERWEWNPFGFDFKEEARDFYNNRESRNTDNEMRIIKDSDSELEIDNGLDTDTIIGAMHKIYDTVSRMQKTLAGSTKFLNTVFAEYSKTKNPYDLIMSYFQNYSYICDYIKSIYVQDVGLPDLEYDWGSSIITGMKSLYAEIYQNKSKYEATFFNTVFQKYDASKNDLDLLDSYIENESTIKTFIDNNFKTVSPINSEAKKYDERFLCLSYNWDSEVSVDREVNVYEHQCRANQLRFYEWWAIFSNVRDNEANYDVDDDDDVFKGVATIYLSYFLTNGQADISPILRIYLDTNKTYFEDKKQDNQWQKFIEEDFKTIIEKLYSLIKNGKSRAKRGSSSNRSQTQRTLVKNMDCIKLIDKYKSNGVADIKHEKPLFYSDSPYIGTSGYPAGDFDSKHMENLIKKLAQTKDRFIFSCRACIGSSAGSKISDDLKAGNQKILNDVFGNFETNFNTDELYVLTIAKVKTVGKKIKEVRKADFWKDKAGSNVEIIKGDFLRDENGEKIQVMEGDFWERVIQNRITEIMITNYPIYDFKDDEYEFTYFKVVPFEDFMLMLKATITI